jgi:predicted amidohydrolase YtcJ
MVSAIHEASVQMAAFGIVQATDMMTGRYNLPMELEAYRLAAERGAPTRFRLCIQWAELFGPRAKPCEFQSDEAVSIWGAKIFADGAIGSATAAIYGRYTSEPESEGALIYAPDRLKSMVRVAHEAGYRIAIHSIGDRSTDLVMDAYEALDEPQRHRIEHAMLLSDSQIERMAKLGIHCTMQPEFLIRFGHSYRHHLGPERAAKLNRSRSMKDAGIPLSFSSDRPIVSGDPWLGVFAACERPEGFAQEENLTFEEALQAYTVMGAAANGEKNALQVGERGEFLVFS